MGQLDKGIETYEKALKLKSNSPSIYLKMGIALFIMKKYKESLDCMEIAESLGVTPPADIMKTLKEADKH